MDGDSMDRDRPVGEGSAAPPVRNGPPAATGLLARIRDVFVAPGRLGDGLRNAPRWFVVTLLGAVLVAVGIALIPADIWEALAREQLLSSGRPIPEGAGASGSTVKIIAAAGAFLSWFVITAISAGLYVLLFGFVLGDEVRYRQSIAAVGHAGLITAVGGLLVAPIRIARRDPQVTLSVGTFVEGLLDPGFVLYFLQGLDLFAMWGWVVTAVIFSRFDDRRTVGSALATVLVVSCGLVAVFALLRGMSPA